MRLTQFGSARCYWSVWRTAPASRTTNQFPGGASLLSRSGRPNGILRLALCGWIAVSVSLFSGCLSRSEHEVIVYSALDEEFAAPVFAEFTKQTGITVRAKYDTESTKTVQLTTELLAERRRPRCDLFWNNEILNTLRLADEGLLQSHAPPTAELYPAEYRDSKSRWHGFAGRARVLIVNTDRVAESDWPDSIEDLADPAWRGQVALAKPLFGTTRTHAVCLFQAWGAERARRFFRDVAGNAQVLSGNKQVAMAVARGQVAWGVTDTDDAIVELEKGLPVKLIYPDQRADQCGTLFIPNSLAILHDCPHPLQAKRLLDFLLTPDVERQLAKGPSAQIPLHIATGPQRLVDAQAEGRPARVETPASVRAMSVDFAEVSRRWQIVSKFLEQTFAQ